MLSGSEVAQRILHFTSRYVEGSSRRGTENRLDNDHPSSSWSESKLNAVDMHMKPFRCPVRRNLGHLETDRWQGRNRFLFRTRGGRSVRQTLKRTSGTDRPPTASPDGDTRSIHAFSAR